MESEPADGVEGQKKGPEVVEPAVGGPRLFGRGAVGVASLLGSPVAGGILLGVNAWRLGQRAGVAVGVGVGLLLTYSLLGLVRVVPAGVPPVAVLLPVGAVIMAWVAGVLQGDAMKGRRRGGMVAAVVVGLVVAGGLYGVLRAVAPARKPAAAATGVRLVKVTVTENQGVSYAPPVEEAEAKKVGKVLEEVGYFDKSGRPKDVAMGLDGSGRRVIVFGVDPAHAGDPQVLKAFAVVAERLIRAGEPVPFVIRLAGPDWKTVKEIKVDVKTATWPTSGPAGVAPAAGATSRPGLPGFFGSR